MSARRPETANSSIYHNNLAPWQQQTRKQTRNHGAEGYITNEEYHLKRKELEDEQKAIDEKRKGLEHEVAQLSRKAELLQTIEFTDEEYQRLEEEVEYDQLTLNSKRRPVELEAAQLVRNIITLETRFMFHCNLMRPFSNTVSLNADSSYCRSESVRDTVLPHSIINMYPLPSPFEIKPPSTIYVQYDSDVDTSGSVTPTPRNVQHLPLQPPNRYTSSEVRLQYQSRDAGPIVTTDSPQESQSWLSDTRSSATASRSKWQTSQGPLLNHPTAGPSTSEITC